MLIAVLQIIGGMILLLGGGEATVRGASSLASRFKISPYVIGATVVAFGTSAPELVVTITAAFRGSGDLALGNVVGSNIANLALILGLAAVINPPSIPRKMATRELPAFLAVVVLLMILAWDSEVGRIGGIILLLTGGVAGFIMMRNSQDDNEETGTVPQYNLVPTIVLVIIGLAGLIGGAQFLINGSVVIARTWGVPEWAIGIGIIALGTSLPEVAASGVAAYKGQGELAVGNVIGSNAFNVFWVLGIGSTLHPMKVHTNITPDLQVFGGLSIFVMGSLLTWGRIPRWVGILLLASYIAYIIVSFSG